MHPKHLSISDFTYELPVERIAKYPLEERDNSKLLVYESGVIKTSLYKNLDEFLPADSLLIFNNTKVVEARLHFQKATGGVIEVFCLEPDSRYPDILTAMQQKGKVWWKCLVGGASKWKHGTKLTQVFTFNNEEVIFEAAIVERLSDCFVIELSWQPEHYAFVEILHIAGEIPLPPYINRKAEEGDKSRYQTIYANLEGSVAAPTAGLHFTESVFEKLAEKNINKEFVTLHVGAGTFKPVKAEKIGDHEMHAEFIDVSAKTIANIRNFGSSRVIAVGTTSLRTIESLYWMGVKANKNPTASLQEISVQQWDPYEIENNTISSEEALDELLRWMANNKLERLITKTQIIIAPSYRLKIAKALITNFHQPQSTLLLLISAITGTAWKEIYEYAMQHDFRFLSYGDGCLLWQQ